MSSPKPRLPWYRLTPGRCLIALLVVEGLLWLVEWFHWLPKSWPVLIAVASVGVFLIVMLLWFISAIIFRWRFQFSLRSLLVLVVVVAIPCSWMAVEIKKAREQKEAVEEIWKAAGWVAYDYELESPAGVADPSGSVRLRKLLGDDFFNNVVSARLDDDAQIERLKGLTQLQWLYLSDTKVSDEGMAHLHGLTQLQGLGLSRTKISDAGLAHLTGLTQLQELFLVGTKVSDEGVKKLQQALPNCTIHH